MAMGVSKDGFYGKGVFSASHTYSNQGFCANASASYSMDFYKNGGFIKPKGSFSLMDT